MHKIILPILFSLSLNTYSQSADFLILKKHHKKIATYFAGNEISFTTETGAYLNGRITGIKSDTVYLKEYLVQMIPTNIGTVILDTLGSNLFKYDYKQIKVIGKEDKKSFNWRGSGASLMGGGALIALGSGAVYLFDREKFSAPLLYAALGLGTIGYFLAKGGSSGMTIGNKYQLIYMKMEQ